MKKPELTLALQLIEQISEDSYDPAAYKDEEKQRIEAAIDEKIAGKQIAVSAEPQPGGGQVIDLMDALRASLEKKKAAQAPAAGAETAADSKVRKSAKARCRTGLRNAERTRPREEVIAESMTTYTLREIQAMLGISRSAISSLMAAGFVSPGRGRRREYRFTFQDVVMLRTAHSLREAQIPGRKILRSLRRLRETLPAELPLSGLRITAAGNELAVRTGDTHWHVDSGQFLLDFEVRPSGASVSVLSKRRRRNAKPPRPRLAGPAMQRAEAGSASAIQDRAYWFEQGTELERSDLPAAEAAYRKAIAGAPSFADPYLNLGCLLCDARRSDEATGLYRTALRHCPDEALLHFNLAIALEDQGKPPRIGLLREVPGVVPRLFGRALQRGSVVRAARARQQGDQAP